MIKLITKNLVIQEDLHFNILIEEELLKHRQFIIL